MSCVLKLFLFLFVSVYAILWRELDLFNSSVFLLLNLIQIPSRPISIVDFHPIQNPMTSSNRRSRFRSNFDCFQSIFDLFWLKYWFRDWKSQFRDWKSWFYDQKSQFLLKKSIYIEKVDQIWPFLIKIDLKFNFLSFFHLLKSILLLGFGFHWRFQIEKVD